MARDRLITLSRLSASDPDAFNNSTETWDVIATEWASRFDVSDGEKLQGGMELSVRLARFTVLSNSATRTITSDDQLTEDGVEWNIRGVKEIGTNERLEITAERRSD